VTALPLLALLLLGPKLPSAGVVGSGAFTPVAATWVQAKTGDEYVFNGTTTVSTGNLTSDPNTGMLVAFVVSYHGTLPPLSSIADTRGMTWTNRTNLVGTNSHTEIWTAPITGSGTCNVTATWASNVEYRHITVVEISGVNGYNAQTSQANVSADPAPSLTLNVTSQPAFVLHMIVPWSNGTPAADAGWTDRGRFGGTNQAVEIETTRVTATGNKTGTWVLAWEANTQAMISLTEG